MAVNLLPNQPVQLDRVRPSDILSEPKDSPLGKILCDKAENIYKNVRTLSTFLSNTYKQPTRSFNALYTFGAGMGSLLSGNLLGLAGVLSGGKGLYDLSSQIENTQLHSILRDINADAEMIGILAQGQEKHYHIIGDNLESIKNDVNELTGKLREIQSINTQGITELQARQHAALTLNKRAIASYEHAEELFAQAQRFSRHSRAIFGKFTHLFQKILHIVGQKNLDVALLEKVTKQAVSSCKNGQDLLDRADEKFNEAFTALREANALKSEAIQKLTLAAQQAEDAFKAGLEKAQYTQKCETTIASTQKRLDRAKQGIKQLLRLVGSLKRDIIKANEATQGKWDNRDFYSGLATGATAGYVYGPITAVACGWATATLVHYNERIRSAAKRAYHYLAGEAPEPSITLKQGELVRAVFADTSSGHWGALRGHPSRTVGTLFINLGAFHTVALPFNLNNENPVSKLDFLNLLEFMGKKLQDKSMTPEHFDGVIHKLSKKILIEGEERPNDPFRIDYIHILKPDSDFQGIIDQIRESLFDS